MGLALYADWNMPTYKITLDGQGGTFTDDAQMPEDVEYGEIIGSQLPTPEKPGYIFTGWVHQPHHRSAVRSSQAHHRGHHALCLLDGELHS